MNETPPTPWLLTLYVSGSSARSMEAIEAVRRICDEDPEFAVSVAELHPGPGSGSSPV